MSELVINGSTALESPRGPAEAVRLIETDFERLYRGIHRYLLHRLFDAELAEELTARTLYKLAGALGRFDGNARQLETWLFRTATNLANTHLRRLRIRRIVFGQWARQQPLDVLPAEAADPEDAERARARAALANLPSKYQTPIVLKYYSGMSSADIAAVLNCSPAAARQRISRGLEKLRNQLRGSNLA